MADDPGRDDGGSMADGGSTADAETLSWRRLWAETTEAIARAGHGRPQARWMCETASGLAGADFHAALDEPATERPVHHLDTMIAGVLGGRPLQYVLGRWAFRHLDLLVDQRVLIPRPETELIVDVVHELLATMQRPLIVADLGTGSGAIGLSLATEVPHRAGPDGAVTVWLTDVSPDALDVARANLAGIGRHGSRVRLAQGSWFDALPAELGGTLDVVVANPPYIAIDDPDVEPSVHEHEPHLALYGGLTGAEHLEAIITGGREWIRPGGWLVMEIGSRQGELVATLLRAAGYDEVTVRRDLAGLDRFAQAKRAAT